MPELETQREAAERPSSPTRPAVFDNPSDLSRSVTVTREPREDLPPPYHGDAVTFSLGGKSVLGAVIRDDKMVTLHASTEPDSRGQGFALAVLERAVQYAADNDLHFQTRDFVVPDRASVYRALARRGYPVKVNFPAASLEGMIEIDTRGSGMETTHPDAPVWQWVTSASARYAKVNRAVAEAN